MIKVFFFLLIIQSLPAFAYVNSKAETGLDLKWNVRENRVDLYVDTSSSGNSSYDLTENSIKSIIEGSINEWNGQSNITINPIYTSSLPAIGESQTIRFTESPAYFGSAVLAVTSIGYSPTTGDILSADILVNESYNNVIEFTSSPSKSADGDYAYLGDVMTHELGHFLGLNHSEVIGSTMLFSVFKGQYSVAHDDIAGVYDLYSSGGYTVKGRVIGGDRVPVFGANVQMIDFDTGDVFSAHMTDENGMFYFKKTPDRYLIYVSPPMELDNLPAYYATAETNFCSGSYKPAFFSKCGGREKGRPQVFTTSDDYSDLIASDGTIDIGEITIRCQNNVNPEYIYSKYSNGTDPYDLFTSSPSDPERIAGDTFVGSFSEAEITEGVSGSGDIFYLDLRDYQHLSSNSYLDLKVITESIGTMVDPEITIERISDSSSVSYTTSTDPTTNRKLLNLSVRFGLSTTGSNNYFKITIKPKQVDTDEQQEILAAPTVMSNPENLYLVLTGVGKVVSGEYSLAGHKDSAYPEDNRFCSEGNPSYTSKANITMDANNTTPNTDGVETMSCGTIDIDNHNNGSGPMSFAIGLAMILLFIQVRETLLKALSK
jgi:hypothetical protein